MSMQDPVADMLTRIRNAQAMHKETVSIPHSKLKQAIVEVLKQEGYVNAVERIEDSAHPTLRVTLRYYEGKPVIEKLQRVSKPSMRVYRGNSHLPKVLGGLGVSIVSTSQGVMSDRQAKKLGIGGEVLCLVE